MNPFGPLNSGLSKYRRHNPSLDGKVPGVEYPRFRGGAEKPAQASQAAHRPANTVYPNEVLPVTYDPGIGPYRMDWPEYEPPLPWHDAPPGSASLRHLLAPGLPAEHEILAAMNPEQLSALLPRLHREPPKQAAPDAIPLDKDVRSDGLFASSLDEHLEDGNQTSKALDYEPPQALYKAALMSQELFAQQMSGLARNPSDRDASALPEGVDYAPGNALDYTVPEQAEGGYDHGPVADMAGADYSAASDCVPESGIGPMSPMPDPTEPAPDQLQYGMLLEDIVEHEMQDMDPYEMMDPYHALGPYGPMPDPRMMGMPMDPFGSMPPGLGPMGPMM